MCKHANEPKTVLEMFYNFFGFVSVSAQTYAPLVLSFGFVLVFLI